MALSELRQISVRDDAGYRQAQLAEYTELRAEIRQFSAGADATRQFAFTLTLGVLGFVFEFKEYRILPFAALVIVFLWFADLRRRRVIYRIGSFIEIRLERDVPGLQWETAVGRHPIQRTVLGRILADAGFPAQYVILVSLYVERILADDNVVGGLAGAAFGILLLLLLVEARSVAASGRRDAIRQWQEIFRSRRSLGGLSREPQPAPVRATPLTLKSTAVVVGMAITFLLLIRRK